MYSTSCTAQVRYVVDPRRGALREEIHRADASGGQRPLVITTTRSADGAFVRRAKQYVSCTAKGYCRTKQYVSCTANVYCRAKQYVSCTVICTATPSSTCCTANLYCHTKQYVSNVCLTIQYKVVPQQVLSVER